MVLTNKNPPNPPPPPCVKMCFLSAVKVTSFERLPMIKNVNNTPSLSTTLYLNKNKIIVCDVTNTHIEIDQCPSQVN